MYGTPKPGQGLQAGSPKPPRRRAYRQSTHSISLEVDKNRKEKTSENHEKMDKKLSFTIHSLPRPRPAWPHRPAHPGPGPAGNDPARLGSRGRRRAPPGADVFVEPKMRCEWAESGHCCGERWDILQIPVIFIHLKVLKNMNSIKLKSTRTFNIFAPVESLAASGVSLTPWCCLSQSDNIGRRRPRLSIFPTLGICNPFCWLQSVDSKISSANLTKRGPQKSL